MHQERRRAQRIPFQQVVSVSLGNGGGEVTAVAQNVSSGGAFLHCDRLISPGSQVALLLVLSVLPFEITHGKAVRVWCVSKVVRVEPQLIDGKFGTALEFVSIETLPQA